MTEQRLQLPAGLQTLIDHGHWPTRYEQISGQDRQSLVPQHLVDQVFPGEQNFCFALPPFTRVFDLKLLRDPEYGWFWAHENARPDQLDHAKVLIIADFKIGSDTAVILDYQHDPINPPVMWLKWYADGKTNHWQKACDTVDEMAARLQLHQLHFKA